MMKYISTRGGGDPVSFEEALLNGLAPGGGLYVPEKWPQIDLRALKGMFYIDVAEAIMYPFVEGSIEQDDFRKIVAQTYSQETFRHLKVTPLHSLQDNVYALELFHGPTIAFKDIALQLLGRLFDHVLQKRGERVTIVGATSGDTGSAAIEGCRHSKNLDIFILFPHDRVSEVQRRQMTTIDMPHVHNVAVRGDFDDCQNMVKAMFNDAQFRSEMNLSAVNSINWARIMAQIVYYVTAALELGAPDKEVSFVVPTGNFGNVYAAYCARQMGLPIKTLAISTNKNDILTRFFETGEMKTESAEASLSPSMDIQISSNFERYLFDLFGRNAEKLAQTMQQFKNTGSFEVQDILMGIARETFCAYRADDDETIATIKKIYEEKKYVLDPHTAVGVKAALELAETDKSEIVSLACAHPAKFPDAVEKAIGKASPLPKHLEGLMKKPEFFTPLKNDLDVVQNFVRNNAQISKKAA